MGQPEQVDWRKILREAEAGIVSQPTMLRDVGKKWGFHTWATQAGFVFPERAGPFLARCESAAEAFMAREFVRHDDTEFEDRTARRGGIALTLQVPAGKARIDMVAATPRTRVAIEVDGLEFHHRRPEQIADDYLRERRVVASGYIVLRFTAYEAFHQPEENWRQVQAAIATWEARR